MSPLNSSHVPVCLYSNMVNGEILTFLRPIMDCVYKLSIYQDSNLLYFLVLKGDVMCFPVKPKIGHTESLMRFLLMRNLSLKTPRTLFKPSCKDCTLCPMIQHHLLNKSLIQIFSTWGQLSKCHYLSYASSHMNKVISWACVGLDLWVGSWFK